MLIDMINPMAPTPNLLDAGQAAEYLGVSRQTLYAYVSRGLLVSEPGPGPSRARRYPRAALERLKAGRGQRAAGETGARTSLFWGLPVVDSSLTLVSDGRIAYRGIDALALADDGPFERAVALLWTADADSADRLFETLPPARGPRREGDLGTALAGTLVRMAGTTALSLGSPRAAVLHRAVEVVGELFRTAGARGGGTLAGRLARGWRIERSRDLDAALILCADHELNVSAFTARCVASADARLEHVLLAALAALHGRRHGGSAIRVAALVTEAERAGARGAIDRALVEVGDVPGFGHPLYPDGDPRGAALMRLVFGDAGPDGVTGELVDMARETLGLRPNLDFGLACLARSLGLADDAAFGLFALGRSAGWIAHALEAWDDGRLVRPRARYVGPEPVWTGA